MKYKLIFLLIFLIGCSPKPALQKAENENEENSALGFINDIDSIPPTTTISLAPGNYEGEVEVELVCYAISGCENIYYTLDGSHPTPGVENTYIYNGPITLPQGHVILKYLSVATNGLKGELKEAFYDIDLDGAICDENYISIAGQSNCSYRCGSGDNELLATNEAQTQCHCESNYVWVNNKCDLSNLAKFQILENS